MSSPWNPDYWKQYNDVELQEFRNDLQRIVEKDENVADEKHQDYRQWIQEISTVLPSQQSNK